jgi:ribonuclease P protein component
MNRRYRLTNPNDFKRVRRTGKSYAHPFIVLVASANGLSHSRFGFTAGRSLGNAVSRNRAKRRLRHLVMELQPQITPGWDIVIIGRKACLTASWPELKLALLNLSKRADLLIDLGNKNVD